jgi:hypothetical protein
VAWKDILGAKVEHVRAFSYDDINEHEDIRAIILAFERALDRCNAVLSGLVRLRTDERLVRVSEAHAELIKGVIMAVLDSREMGLSREQRQTGRTILARELSAVTNARPIIRVAAHASS